MPIKGYVAKEEKQKLVEFSYEPAKIGSHDVEVQITHCGICHSDVHLIDNDWKISRYPFIPGHEIIGAVKETGIAVTHLKKGDRVGIGWQRSSCMTCEDCLKGEENLCATQTATCVGNHGGFAEYIRMGSHFVFPIPKGLSSENAAPLLCGGITVYSPLRSYDVKPFMRVGIIGVGGLGHLAIQFARAFGCEVTAFSSSSKKEAEARTFGASHFVSSTDTNAMQRTQRSLDFILTTANADMDWNTYLGLLKANGRLCFVGAPPSEIKIPAFSLIVGRKSLCGSPIGSRSMINEMLLFAERHHIEAKTEVVPIHEVNSAIQRVRENKARYRMVLKM